MAGVDHGIDGGMLDGVQRAWRPPAHHSWPAPVSLVPRRPALWRCSGRLLSLRPVRDQRRVRPAARPCVRPVFYDAECQVPGGPGPIYSAPSHHHQPSCWSYLVCILRLCPAKSSRPGRHGNALTVNHCLLPFSLPGRPRQWVMRDKGHRGDNCQTRSKLRPVSLVEGVRGVLWSGGVPASTQGPASQPSVRPTSTRPPCFMAPSSPGSNRWHYIY